MKRMRGMKDAFSNVGSIGKFLGCIFCFLILNSCSISYKLEGGSIDYSTTKTILIRDFPNRATLVYPPLSQAFDQALRNRYIDQTRLKAVSSNADIEIEGEITRYEVVGTAVKEDQYASQTRLTITVKVRYTNNKDPKKDVDQSFSAFREYPSTSSLDAVQDGLIKEIVAELVDMIYNETVASW